MELKQSLLQSVRDGKLRPLKLYLKNNPEILPKDFVDTPINRQTLLSAAAKHGHLHIVRYLIEECLANIEQKCRVEFDGDHIEDASPLWTASASGHLEIVTFLVEKGAEINSTTRALSTPLRAACYDGHLGIVKYLVEKGADINFTNRHGHTCLMIACYKGHLKIVRYLIEKGADINKRSIRGYTAMHDCADAGHVAIMMELIQKGGQMTKDAWNMNPLFAAAMSGQEQIYKLIITYDLRLEMQGCRTLCSDIDKISALEIMGATFVDKMSDFAKATRFWRKAFEIRQARIHTIDFTTGDLNEMLQFRKRLTPPIEAYDNAVEFNSIEELDRIKNNPDALRMQALIIRERILGPTHPETLYNIRRRGALYADMGDLDSCFRLWLYALKLQQRYLTPLSPETESSLISFAELISFMIFENIFTDLFDKIFIILNKCVDELKSALRRYSKSSAISNEERVRCLNLIGNEDNYEDDANRNVVNINIPNHYLYNNQNDIDQAFIDHVRNAIEPYEDHDDDDETQSAEARRSEQNALDEHEMNDLNDGHGNHADQQDANREDQDMIQINRQREICLRYTIGKQTEFVTFDRILVIIIYFIGCLCRFEDKLTKEQKHQLNLIAYQLVSLNLKGRQKRTLLHIACNHDLTAQLLKSTLCEIPIKKVISLFIKVGANINALDSKRNTPLHIACQHRGNARNEITQMLIDHSAHLDLRNANNEVALLTIMEWNRLHPFTNFRPLKSITLKCLCASVLKRKAIRYKGLIPETLIDFVKYH